MKTINEKLEILSKSILSENKIKIVIFGLGSVGNYLLNFLLDLSDKQIEIVVAGRNLDTMEKNVNIAKVSSIIKGYLVSNVSIKEIDLENINQISDFLKCEKPDFIVNTSRAFSGIKYGSISWNKIRAYGIWSPLSVKFIKNIMTAYEMSASTAIVINTSYSDVVNAWLKSAGYCYPDFGSGNLNHLIPRIKLAIKEKFKVQNFNEICVVISTSHFHDVVISKEGHSEGVDPLMSIRINNRLIDYNINEVFTSCSISMPVDQKRNMMNASSNFEIIYKIIDSLRNKRTHLIHSPGALGEIGGFPLLIEGDKQSVRFYTEDFSLEKMRLHNKESIYLDGIENISSGVLTFTDELISKIKKEFNVEVKKNVNLSEVSDVADFLISNLIK